MDHKAKAEAAAQRVIELQEEVESSGYAALDYEKVRVAKAALHEWVDAMIGIVISPALGRVTVLHPGRESSIASPELAYKLSKPA